MDHRRLEERIAHLEKTLDEVSDVVARQDRDLDLLHRRVAMLMQREAGREADGVAAPEADKAPPHW